jgi:hypothetical protein
MSIPTGGAGGLAKAAGAGASNAGVAKSGAEAAKTATPAVTDAVNGAGKGAGNDLAQKAGFGSGGGVGSSAPAPGGASGVAAGLEAVKNLPAPVKDGAKTLMGAGGTGAAQEPGQEDGGVGKASGGGMKVAGAAAAVPAAGAAAHLMFAMMILNWLKTMMFAAMAMLMNLGSMILGAIVAGVKFVFGGVMAAGAAVSSFVGGAISVAAGAFATVTATAMVIGVGVVSVISGVGNDTAQKEGPLFDCSVNVVAAVDATDPALVGESDAQTEANAKLVFGVLSAWGMSDENVAGILGNWDAESGIDPTGVETVFGEPFSLGPKKQAAEAAGFDVDQVAPDYGAEYPAVDLLGIGLGQWSNGRNTQLLDYATSANNSSWATLETQLGFMISTDSGAPVIQYMIATPIGSAAEAAVYFHHEWEKSADTSMTAREDAANSWFAQMGGWEKNQALADSILAQSGSTVGDADGALVSNAKENCQTDTTTVSAGLQDGGMTLEEAQAFMENYKSVGEAYLVDTFGAGGPGDCGFGKADNCVGFSSYFIHKYTSVKQYVNGNGIDTAGSLAEKTDRETSTTPTVYSVFSKPTGSPEGHTGIILGIDGDTVIIGEAACGTNHEGTRAYARPLSDLSTGGWVFTDTTDLLVDETMGT